MSSETANAAVNTEHTPSSAADPSTEEEKVIRRLIEKSEFHNARAEVKALYKAFVAHANANGMLDFPAFRRGLEAVCPDLNGELMFFLMSEEEHSNLVTVEQVVVFLSKVIYMTFSQRIKLLFKVASGNRDETEISKKELVEFFHKAAPLLHYLDENDPLYSTPLLSPSISMRALSAAMKDEPLGGSFTGTPAMINIHAPTHTSTPSTGHLTSTSSLANQLVLNAMTHSLALDQIQTLVDECFGFSALDPEKSTLSYQDFQAWFLAQKRVALLYREEETARREQQKIQLEVKVSIKVQELIDNNKFTEEEVKCIRNIFDHFDSDYSGELNPKKILAIFPETSDQAMQEFMKELDPKRLGFVTFDRFLEILGPFFIQQSEAAFEAASAYSTDAVPITNGTVAPEESVAAATDPSDQQPPESTPESTPPTTTTTTTTTTTPDL